MDMNDLKGSRGILAVVALVVITVGLFTALFDLNGNVSPGISPIYNALAFLQAPNSLSMWVYDWRGFDTLIETGVIYVGAIVSVMVIGRGVVKMTANEGEPPVVSPPLSLKTESLPIILKYFALPTAILLTAYGIMIVTGVATSGGGGFQCGVIIASAYLLSVIMFGKNNPMNFTKKFLVAIGSLGWALYALLGLPGFIMTQYWQYNVGTDLWNLVPGIWSTIFGDPFRLALTLQEGTFYSTSGIVPLINLGEALNVIGAIGLIFFAFIYGWSDATSDQPEKGGSKQ
jgi:multisubunit Na+/H+ antiporter MnhB subunit